MATRFYLRTTTTYPHALRAAPLIVPGMAEYRDMLLTAGAVPGSSFSVNNTGDPTVQEIGTSTTSPIAFWSEGAPIGGVTLSGTVTVHTSQTVSSGVTKHRIRYRLYKITAGGSDVITPIAGPFDTPSDIGVGVSNVDWSFTLPSAVTLSVGERLIVRIWIFTTDGSALNSSAKLKYGQNSSGFNSYIEFTQTFTPIPNLTPLSLRQTTVAGIGTFRDLLPTFNTVAYVDAQLNSQATSSEIQWTLTAGGAVAEWISPRLTAGWDLPDDQPNGKAAAEAVFIGWATPATDSWAMARVKLFLRKPDGTETQVWGWAPNAGLELSTSATTYDSRSVSYSAGKDFYQKVDASEDDRVIVRVYAFPTTGHTMVAGKVLHMGYDGPANAGFTGTTAVLLAGLSATMFKAESDPAKSNVVPSGQSMSGLGNGQ